MFSSELYLYWHRKIESILLLLQLPSDNLLFDLLDPRAFQALKILQELNSPDYKYWYELVSISALREDIAVLEMILNDGSYGYRIERFNTKVRLVLQP